MTANDLDRIAGKIASFGVLNNPGKGSRWNPERRDDNCVWVSTAISLMKTVPELTREIGMEAPHGGATKENIYKFLAAVCKLEGAEARIVDRQNNVPDPMQNGTCDGKIPYGSIVCYRRWDGSGHCVWKPSSNSYYCFQHCDSGHDVGSELAAPGAAIVLHWTLVPKNAAGPSAWDPAGKSASSIPQMSRGGPKPVDTRELEARKSHLRKREGYKFDTCKVDGVTPQGKSRSKAQKVSQNTFKGDPSTRWYEPPLSCRSLSAKEARAALAGDRDPCVFSKVGPPIKEIQSNRCFK